MYHLENENIKIAIDSNGAELKSVFSKANQQELLWQGNREFWGKSSPVLFPIVGTLKNGMYVYEGKGYKLPRHGFARDCNFTLEEVSDTQLIFSLKSSEETLKNYPFLFKLQIIYTLQGNGLKVVYNVENLSDEKTMYFSLGAHPAFKMGDFAENFSRYSLLFNKDEQLEENLLNNGLLSGRKQNILLNNQKLQLSYKLFENDALVILNMKSDKITLMNYNDVPVLDFEFNNFPYFGLWTVKDSGFLCLEPWAGVADFESHNHLIQDKFGINTLEPKEIWSASWIFSIPF